MNEINFKYVALLHTNSILRIICWTLQWVWSSLNMTGIIPLDIMLGARILRLRSLSLTSVSSQSNGGRRHLFNTYSMCQAQCEVQEI